MNSIKCIKSVLKDIKLYSISIDTFELEIQYTIKKYKGDVTLIIFPLLKIFKKPLKEIGQELGNNIKKKLSFIKSFNVINGFLNLEFKDEYYLELLLKMKQGLFKINKKKHRPLLMIEYSSPNTNKPLHLGHIRNCILGQSMSNIFDTLGYKVIRTQLINDRGIHICKSMVAWQKLGKSKTPKNTNIKGDHFVGKYYVEFENLKRKEIERLLSLGYNYSEAEKKSTIMQSVRETLRKWENGDNYTIEIWNKLNKWVYEGFEETYRRLGITFDEVQYESNTYILGKKIVKEGIQKGIFYKKYDGSVWIDFKNQTLNRKLLLRSDGTSVYLTQDIGTAVERFRKYPIDKLIYTVGEEQNYHFKILFIILNRLGYPWSKKLFHLSYGMVNLPDGKMKSREGTVVDADDLMSKMHNTAMSITQKLGKLKKCSKQEQYQLFEKIGIAALKYYILKVNPKKSIIFDPMESIDFKGCTGTYIQYTYARICSLKIKSMQIKKKYDISISLNMYERTIIKMLEQYISIIKSVENNLDPSILANYIYNLAKKFNDFYQNINVIYEINENKKYFRIKLSSMVGYILKNGMELLGISMLERM
ncbi:MAG: arginine--tRNA ligase [Candidatus Bostrichicola ureolyticus]|nr:MAG: arginine--tRNA ligase [Candidatus Bostrichicola ureolyticus]